MSVLALESESSGSQRLERLWNYRDHRLFTIGLSLQRHRVTKFLFAPLFGQILAIPSTRNKDLTFEDAWLLAWDWLNLQTLAEVFSQKPKRTKCWFWKWNIHWESWGIPNFFNKLQFAPWKCCLTTFLDFSELSCFHPPLYQWTELCFSH